jgi:hypothetical protein
MTIAISGSISVSGSVDVAATGSNPQMVLASAYGVTPTTADCGPCFAAMPRDSVIWFEPGVYTFLTYPSEANFRDKFYRGIGVEWHCNGALPDLNTAAFTWSYAPSTNFGTDTSGGNLGDMTNAGLSPIEGIAIYGNDPAKGIGFQLGNDTGRNVYFTRPKNFSIQNFGVGFQYKQPMANCFMTGAEDCVFKGNGTNLIVDITGSSNSGENFYFKSCYFGNALVIGAKVVKVQLCTFDNCSFDYNRQHGYFQHAAVKMKNCYVEGTPANAGNGTPQTWFGVYGVGSLDVDTGCNIFMLGGSDVEMNGWDFFTLDSQGFGNPNVRCNASFFSAPQRYKPLVSNWVLNAYGSMMRCNGGSYPAIVSESVNLFPDVRATATGFDMFPGSTGVTRTIPPFPLPNTGANSAFALTPGTAGASFVWNRMPVEPGKELYLQWHELTNATLTAVKTLTCKFYTADGVLIGDSVFNTPATHTNAVSADALNAWTPQTFAILAITGAAYAQVSLSIAPYNAGDTGIWYVGNIYAFV